MIGSGGGGASRLRRRSGRVAMDPNSGVIILGIVQVICLLALAGAGFALWTSGRRAAEKLQPLTSRATRLKDLGTRVATSARAKSQQIATVGQALAEHLAQKWRTTSRIVHEVTHPD